MNKGLRHLDTVVKYQLNKNAAFTKGAGAAAGLAYGLNVFLDAIFVSGINFVSNLSKVREFLTHQKFDYIITGEGKFDCQILHGKLISGVIDLGRQFNVPVLTICDRQIKKYRIKSCY